MNKYDYRKAICDDIKQWLENNKNEVSRQRIDRDDDEFFDWLNEELWGEDSVTGNGLDYYDTEEQCQEYVAANLALYFEAANEFCDFPNSGTPWVYKNPAQHMDCTIRCYLLGECIWKVIEKN